MRKMINFSSQPFVQRDARLMALWVANACLLILLMGLTLHYYNLRHDNLNLHQKLADINTEERQMQDEMGQILRQVEALDIQKYKREVDQFHAIQTAFLADWGELLDHLATLLNEDVRLVRLQSNEAPQNEADSVTFLLSGEARNKQAELNFVQALQKHPSFQQVRFEAETYQGANRDQVQFEIRFQFVKPGGSNG